MKKRLIGHLDADCFYVSAERVRFPFLRGQLVGVLGNQGACVIAKSYELKAKGVSTGMPIWDAAKLCPEAVFVKRDFRWYEVLSRKMLDVLHRVSPRVEYYSIDEMFFDATDLSQVFGLPRDEAVTELQRRMLEEVGVPASIGIAATKTLAKLGSDSTKPFGCRVLHEDVDSFLHSQPVGELCGIGRRSERKLAEHGILTCRDFSRADRLFIRDLLTIKGEALWYELHGDSVQSILTKRPPHKCISRGGSLGKATADSRRLTGWATRNTERLIEELDYYQVFTQRLTMMLEFKEGGGWSGSVSLMEPTALFNTLIEAGKMLMAARLTSVSSVELSAPQAEAHVSTRVSHMHLLADQLCLRRMVQRNLFSRGNNPRSERLAAVKRLINEKVGRFAVRSGDTLHLPDIYKDTTNRYDICDVHGKMCF